MAKRHLLLAIAGGLLVPVALAAGGLQVPGVGVSTGSEPSLECWLAHAQVQPPPQRVALSAAPSFVERYRLAAQRHAGAEHPTAARLRPCNALPPPLKLSAGEGEPRP
jgi:hypothetical protein